MSVGTMSMEEELIELRAKVYHYEKEEKLRNMFKLITDIENFTEVFSNIVIDLQTDECKISIENNFYKSSDVLKTINNYLKEKNRV